jgi:hypothetical protein
MMTFADLRASLEDRVRTLEHAYSAEIDVPLAKQNRYNVYTLEGRLEEARAILRLVASVDTRPALMQIDADGSVELVISDPEPEWGEQQRGDWPISTFADLLVPREERARIKKIVTTPVATCEDDAEPGTDRHDPGRC